MKDQLFILKPDFMDQGAGPFFCPESALVEGMLSFYPFLRQRLEVHYIDFSRPRQELVALLGSENQGAPKLILGEPGKIELQDFNIAAANGKKFIASDIEICRYLAKVYGCGMPH